MKPENECGHFDSGAGAQASASVLLAGADKVKVAEKVTKNGLGSSKAPQRESPRR
jgi:hypothetical protein